MKTETKKKKREEKPEKGPQCQLWPPESMKTFSQTIHLVNRPIKLSDSFSIIAKRSVTVDGFFLDKAKSPKLKN